MEKGVSSKEPVQELCNAPFLGDTKCIGIAYMESLRLVGFFSPRCSETARAMTMPRRVTPVDTSTSQVVNCGKKMGQQVACNGHSLLNNVDAIRALVEMSWYFEPTEVQTTYWSEAAIRKMREPTGHGYPRPST